MVKIILIFFGPQGSGKGTQAELLAKEKKFGIISIGELFRHELRNKTKLGQQANRYVLSGKLVPDDITGKLIFKAIKQNKNKPGFIFDGYPRNLIQLYYLLKILKQQFGSGTEAYGLEINISDQEAKKRLGGRRSCSCGRIYHLIYNPPKKKEVCDKCKNKLFVRADDYPKAITQRLKLYHRQTKPLLDYWRKSGKLIKINGRPSIARVHQDVIKKLNQHGLINKMKK